MLIQGVQEHLDCILQEQGRCQEPASDLPLEGEPPVLWDFREEQLQLRKALPLLGQKARQVRRITPSYCPLQSEGTELCCVDLARDPPPWRFRSIWMPSGCKYIVLSDLEFQSSTQMVIFWALLPSSLRTRGRPRRRCSDASKRRQHRRSLRLDMTAMKEKLFLSFSRVCAPYLQESSSQLSSGTRRKQEALIFCWVFTRGSL